MIKKLKFILLGFICFLRFFDPTLVGAKDYTILEAQHIKFQYRIGIFPFEGHFTLENSIFAINFENPSASKLRLKIDLNSSSAGFFLATSAMLGESVLYAKKYPYIFFESKRVLVNDNNFKIIGDITIRGISKEITISAKLQNPKILKMKDKKNLKFQIAAKLNRSDFNAVGYANVVGDVIDLNSSIDLITGD